jgi:HEAT repeat protein
VVDESSTVVVVSLVQMITGSMNRYRSHLTNEKAAIAIIEKIGGEQAVDALAGLLGNNFEINEAVADSLGTLGDVRAVEPLIGVLDEKAEAVARALGVLGDARAVDPLIETLEGIFDSYRGYYGRKEISAFIEALVKLGDKKAIEPLVRGLDAEHLEARERTNITEAISLLLEGLEIDTKEKENLNRFLTGSDPGMRAMGISMLKGMTDGS